jgi:predicted phosphodiesterase
MWTSVAGAGRFGLLADSHGDLGRTEQAAAVLLAAGAERLIHLGDFCDTVQESSWVRVMQALQRYGMLTVKGNNDFLVETILKERPPGPDPAEVQLRAFLKSLPITLVADGLCFAHSLPYDSLRSFYEPVDDGTTVKAVPIFQSTAHRILFCGHAHTPVLFRWRAGQVSREAIPPDLPVAMKGDERYIAVVGAVEDGECALYDGGEGTYRRIRLD